MEDEGERCFSGSLSTQTHKDYCGLLQTLCEQQNAFNRKNMICKLLKHLIRQHSNVKLAEKYAGAGNEASPATEAACTSAKQEKVNFTQLWRDVHGNDLMKLVAELYQG